MEIHYFNVFFASFDENQITIFRLQKTELNMVLKKEN